jgi:hypothetical protein
MELSVIPAQAGTQGNSTALILDPRLRGDDDESNATTLAHERQPAKLVS